MITTEIKLIDAYWRIMDRIYNRDHLKWIIQLEVKHNDPALFGLKNEDSLKMRIRYLKGLKQPLEAEFADIKAQYLRGERPYAHIPLNSLQEQIDKLSKAIYFNRQRLKGDTTNQPFDLTALKAIPLDRITKINSNLFFQTNPFRTEKEPSNSLHWDKKTNRFFDFATGKTGDAIDLYCAVNAVDFKTACKEMQSL